MGSDENVAEMHGNRKGKMVGMGDGDWWPGGDALGMVREGGDLDGAWVGSAEIGAELHGNRKGRKM